jgi:type IV pilus biogenesis protein CpaD/CtpE
MRRIAVSAVLSAACLTIVGCAPSPAPAPAKAEAEASAPAEAETPAPFVAGEGEPQIWEPLAEDDPAMAALAVVKFDDLPSLSNISAVRGFVTGSGDPAMNGLKVYLAFVSPHDQRAFLLGDFLDYRVIAALPRTHRSGV